MGDQRRILHVISTMNRGGAETWIMHVYRHIDRSHIAFDFAVQTDQLCHYDGEIRALGGRIFPHPSLKAAGLRSYSQKLASTLREHGPFAGVHSTKHEFSGLVLRVAEKAGVPLRIAHSQTTQDGRPNSWLINVYRWSMRKLIRRHATHLFGCSRAACEALFGPDCWSDPRVRVVRNAIDLVPYAALPTDRRALREQCALPMAAPLIGHVGRFAEPKNHRFLIEIFAAVLQKLPTAHLLLVGDGPLRPAIEALVRKKSLQGNVHFLGIHPDVPLFMGALDLFLFPSLYEGVPLVVIEAQAAGVPCVVADTVPIEADLGIGLVRFVGLQADVGTWEQHLEKSLSSQRPHWSSLQQALQAAGYDIRDVATQMERIYVNGGFTKRSP